MALPMIIGQLSQMLYGLGDLWVAGMASKEMLAAVGVANGFHHPLLVLGIGISMGISPYLSYQIGKVGHHQLTPQKLATYGLLISFPLVILSYLSLYFLPYLGILAELISEVASYLQWVLWGIPPLLVFMGLKELLQAQQNVRFANALSLGLVPLNIYLNYYLVFNLDMGIKGLAIATLLVRIILALITFIYARYVFAREVRRTIPVTWIKDLLKFGLPVGGLFFIEVCAFGFVGVAMGRFRVEIAAAHQVVIGIASTTFMIPLALSGALSVLVGENFGASNRENVLIYTKQGVLLTVIFSLFTTLLFTLFPLPLMKLFTLDPLVLAAGIPLMIYCALFQMGDVLQVVLGGILRGLKTVKQTAIHVFVGLWMIGTPIGVYAAFELDWQERGLWLGLMLGQYTIALLNGVLLYKKLTPKRYAVPDADS